MFWSKNELLTHIYTRIQNRHKEPVDSNLIRETLETYLDMVDNDKVEYIPGQGFIINPNNED